jgi:predicted membrane chloride channel (bestrophin family)
LLLALNSPPSLHHYHCCHLLPLQLLDELERLLPKPEVDALEREYNPVLGIIIMLSKTVDAARRVVPVKVFEGMEVQIRSMTADALACQRINYTPMPMAYIVHMRWARSLYCPLWACGGTLHVEAAAKCLEYGPAAAMCAAARTPIARSAS